MKKLALSFVIFFAAAAPALAQTQIGISCPNGVRVSDNNGGSQCITNAPLDTYSNIYSPSAQLPGGTAAQSNGTAPTTANTQQSKGSFCNAGQCTYVPLEPLPITGFSNCYGASNPNAPCQNPTSFQGLLANSFKLLLGAGGLLAVIMLVIGALTYMFSDVIGDKFKAKTRIRNAMWAIVLLVSSYLILNTINPDLVTFKLTLTSPATGGTVKGAGDVSGSAGASTVVQSQQTTAALNEQVTQCQNQSVGNRICTMNYNSTGALSCTCGTGL